MIEQDWEYCKKTSRKELKCDRCDKVIPKGSIYWNPHMRFYNYRFCSVECIGKHDGKPLNWF